MGWDDYKSYDQIVSWLKSLDRSYDWLHLKELGVTHENRSILGLEMIKNANKSSPAIFIDAGGE